MNPNTRTKRLSMLATAALLSLSASAFAADEMMSASTLAPDVQAAVTDAVYAGGEAMAPEVERRVMAMISGRASRADVRQELADARSANLMPGAGEIADRPELLQARVAYNDRQAQTIMARYEADRQRLMAAQQAQAQAAAMAAATPAPSADAQATAEPATTPMAAAPSVGPAAPADTATAAPADQQPSTEQLIDEATAPADTPLPSNDRQRPASADEQPAAKPDEMPISGPVEADAISSAVDTE
jgi:hypothetical protein